MLLPRLILICIGLTILSGAAPPPPAEAHLLNGENLQGAVLRVTNAVLEIRLKSGEMRSLPLQDILSVDFHAQPKDGPAGTVAYHEVKLADGSLLRAADLEFAGPNLVAKWAGAKSLAVPLSAVATVLFDAQDPANVNELAAALAKKPKADLLRLMGRDGKTVNTFEGVIGNAADDGKTLRFTPEGGDPAQLAVTRLRALHFHRPGAASPPLGKLFDVRGNQFALQTLELTETTAAVMTPAGLAFEIPRAEAARLDLSAGKLVYLSDLEPTRVESEMKVFSPPTGRSFGRDRTLLGQPLSVGRKRYSKGISLHAKTILEFDATGYNFFRAALGIDDSAGQVGDALVRVEGDGKELFSDVVSAQDAKAKELDLKITGVKRLRLTVDFRDALDLGEGDHVTFAEARMMK